ncbi:Uncharacterised protein [Pantoea agglomerans]|uniref:Uncharacterized protein n=1 Tax=Enterobacter agglomerans TaxID=549 RepID=A0A379ABV8_ENTAG|nr:Uncharacterised protein [Pantoea agglomerans]
MRNRADPAGRDAALAIGPFHLRLHTATNKKAPHKAGLQRPMMSLSATFNAQSLLTFNFFQTVEWRFRTQRFFDTDQLVVLSNTVRTTH